MCTPKIVRVNCPILRIAWLIRHLNDLSSRRLSFIHAGAPEAVRPAVTAVDRPMFDSVVDNIMRFRRLECVRYCYSTK